MKYVLIIAVAAALAAVAAATPRLALSEDFGGGQFPPAEWTTEGSGSGNWSWTNPGGHARGNVSVAPFGNVKTKLKSAPFRVSAGTALYVLFRYKTDGFTEVKRYAVIGEWRKSVPYTANHQWTLFTEDSTPMGPGVYRLEFEMSLSGGSHGMGGVWDIDDVQVIRRNAAVDPTSLGRVKALFRRPGLRAGLVYSNPFTAPASLGAVKALYR
jgi:hypothetical protein